MLKKLSIMLVGLLVLMSTIFGQDEVNYNKRMIAFGDSLEQMITDKEPGLSVIVTYKNDIIFENYYGYANLLKNDKLNANHVLGIASMSKQFTGMAALCLVEQGKLDLTKDISAYFPELPIQGRKITIKQLMTHTSGLPELTQNTEFMDNISQRHKVNEIVKMGLKGEFRSEPGEKWMYCNTGYTITVALIEKLSGMNFSEFLQKNIFDPLEMKNTYCPDYNHDADTATPRYFQDTTGYVDATVMHFSNLIGGGSIISNVQDMAKWNKALLTGNHLPENYKSIFDPILLNNGENTDYGLGLGKSDHNGRTFYYHPGQGDGMNAINLIFPDEEVSITVIRNMSKPKVSSNIVALMAADYLFKQNLE